MSTKSKSFRLPISDVDWLTEVSAKNGITQTELVSKCISSAKFGDGMSIANEGIKDITKNMNKGGIASVNESDETLKMLGVVGITTASSIAGYHITGWIMKQFEMDENKGIQVVFGMVTGLGALLMTLKDKK